MNSMPLVSTRDAGRRARWVVVAGFALLAVWFAGGFAPFVNPNELSRFEMIYAVVEEGTFRIDNAVRVLGDHDDKAVSGGHLYSNKAPGLALAAIPVYRLLRCVLPAPRSGADVIFTVLLPLLTVSLAAVVALGRLGARLATADSRVAGITLFALAFGTSFVYYSRSFFGHVWAGSLLFLGWDLLRRVEQQPALRRPGWSAFAAGLLAGWAFLSEYTVAPMLLCLVLRGSAPRVWRRLALFVAGIGVPVAILLAYQAICFGSPFTPSYAREAYPPYAELAHHRFLGFGLPDPVTLWNFLFHPARGVLLFSPFFAWAVVGFVRWWRSREDRADCLFVSGALVSLLLMLAAYPNWHGGWSLGSRYVVPVFLFVGLAIGRALHTPLSRGLFLAAVVFSVANHFLLTLTWPSFPLFMPWPAATGSRWFLARGWIGTHIGPASPAGDAIAVLLALCVLLVGLTVSVRAAEPLMPHPLVSLVVGLLPLVVLLTRPPELGFQARLWRAAIYGKYSGRDPTREELRQVILSAQTPAERRQAVGVWRSYGPNP